MALFMAVGVFAVVPVHAEEGVEMVEDGDKRVYYPASIADNGPYPVIAWANGTGCPTGSYVLLIEEFVKGGYIVVADSTVMSGDGKAQISSIDYIIEKNSDPNSFLYGKVNVDKIGAAGHSQGGRSVTNASKADSRIKAAVNIAGSPLGDERKNINTPTLYLTGSADLIVPSSMWVKPAYDGTVGMAAYASLKGGVHTTCMADPKKISGYAVGWFDAVLKGDNEKLSWFRQGGKLFQDQTFTGVQSKNIADYSASALFDNPLVAGIGIAVVALVGVFGYLSTRKKKQA